MRKYAAAVVVAAMLALGIVGCTSEAPASDAQLRSEIATRLDANNITTVQVSVIDGAATLTGTADQATADRAAEIARGVEGVKSVTNQIAVAAPLPLPGPVEGPDAVLAAKVNQRLIADAALAGSKITPNGQKGGVVTLTGTVPTEAAKASAEKTARSVEGVTNVVNQLSVVAPPVPDVTVPDAQLKDQVNEALDKQFPDLTLFVQVSNGTVTLSGAVPTNAIIVQVSNAIHALKGVKAVDTSRLRVQGSDSKKEDIGAPSNKN